MALETGNFIDDLVDTNPVSATDLVRFGAPHIRLIKEVLQNSFSGSIGAIIAAGVDAGTVNAIVITPVTPLLEYTPRMMIVWLQGVTNTGATTINISGLGAKSVVSVANAALASGDLVAGRVYVGIYDGTSVQLIAVTKNYVDNLAFSSALPFQTGNAGKIVTTDGTSASWTEKLLAGTIRFADSTDTTKLAAFDASGISTATTRTFTLPNVNGTLLTTGTTLTVAQGGTGATTFTDGGVLIGNATGAVQVTTAGTSGQVLTSNGAGVDPTFQTAQPPAMVLLSTVTASNSATIDIETTFDSTYDQYLIVVSKMVVQNNGIDIYCRLKQSGSYGSSSYNAFYSTSDTGSSTFSTSAFGGGTGSQITIATSLSNSAGVSASFRVFINSPSGDSFKDIDWKGTMRKAIGQTGDIFGFGGVNNSAAVTGVRFFTSSGNISSGSFRLYGIKNS